MRVVAPAGSFLLFEEMRVEVEVREYKGEPFWGHPCSRGLRIPRKGLCFLRRQGREEIKLLLTYNKIAIKLVYDYDWEWGS